MNSQEQEEFVKCLDVELEKIKALRKERGSTTSFLWGFLSEMCTIQNLHDEGVILTIKPSGSSQRFSNKDFIGREIPASTKMIKRGIIQSLENLILMYEMHLQELKEDL